MKFGHERRKKAAKAHHVAKIKEDRKHILSSNSRFFLREAYKALRTNVNLALLDEEGCKVVMVTSAMQSEGKSLTSLNLAISLAQTDQRVLLIDCDLRKPKLNRLLNVTAVSGMSNLLMDSSRMDVTILSEDRLGIDVILSGDIPPNPSELLASVRMQKLLEALKERYDYIIIDTPPIDMVIDAVVLAPLCNGVLFVVKAGQTERGAVLQAIEQLEYAKARVLGFVFNAVTAESAGTYGKYKYKRYGRYSYYKYGRYGYGHYGYGHYGYGYGYTHPSQQDNNPPAQQS